MSVEEHNSEGETMSDETKPIIVCVDCDSLHRLGDCKKGCDHSNEYTITCQECDFHESFEQDNVPQSCDCGRVEVTGWPDRDTMQDNEDTSQDKQSTMSDSDDRQREDDDDGEGDLVEIFPRKEPVFTDEKLYGYLKEKIGDYVWTVETPNGEADYKEKRFEKVGEFKPDDDALERVPDEAKGELVHFGTNEIFLWPFIDVPPEASSGDGETVLVWADNGDVLELNKDNMERTGIVLESFHQIAEVNNEGPNT